jgi:hypothetical protein
VKDLCSIMYLPKLAALVLAVVVALLNNKLPI